MKKFLVILMMSATMVSVAACGNSKKTTDADQTTATTEVGKTEQAATTANAGESEASGDMSAYPANFEEWTIDNMMAYLKAEGVCVKDEWSYIQNEDECVPAETGISKAGSYMSDDADGSECLLIFWFDPAADQAAVKEQLEYVRANKMCNELFDNQPIDHCIGNFAFCYSVTSLDDQFVAAVDAAYEKLVTEMKLEPAF